MSRTPGMLPFDESVFSQEQQQELDRAYHRYHTKKYVKKNRKKVRASYARWLETHREYNRSRCKKWYMENRAQTIVNGAAWRSRKEGLPFDLDKHVAEIQARIDAGVCELSGVHFDVVTGDGQTRVKPNTPSIDRIIPAKGYVYSNIRIIAFALNVMFMNWGEDVVREMTVGWLSRTGSKLGG